MCGIAGIVHPKASEFYGACDASISHRGPDSHGFYSQGNIALIHRRLAIQDLSVLGNQPMFSHDRRFVIIYNGEIYNHWELRKELKDVDFKSSSDTETLLYGYIQFGPDILNKLNGIFALAILEIETGELFIARDQFGVKPLYYTHLDTGFCFSSELKTFLSVPGLDRSISLEGLINYIHFLWSPGKETPLKKVRKLEAGHYIKMNINAPEHMDVVKYYEIPFNGKYSNKSEPELIAELEEKLVNAVKRQLLSDVPVGYFLSGGLDSSLIVAIAKKLSPGKRLKCFTIDTSIGKGREGFTEDLPYAQLVANALDVDLEVIKADIDILRDFDNMIWHLDEPQADAAPLNVWNICKSAREQGYVVLLGGTGGDDLFSGYRRHQALYYDRIMDQVPHWIIKPFSKGLNILSSISPRLRRVQKFLTRFEKNNEDEQLAQYYGWLSPSVIKKLFNPKHRSVLNDYDPSSILVNALKNIPNEKSRLNKMLYWDMKYFLTDHNLNYTDKMSMAHGVEVRVPYLDKELVEFSTTISPQLKMKGITTKYLLKKVAEKYLPYEVIYRPKTGFGAPVREWIGGDLYEKLLDDFSDEHCALNGDIFDASKVRELIQQNRDGKIDAAYPILALMAINSWYKQFILVHDDMKSTSANKTAPIAQ